MTRRHGLAPDPKTDMGLFDTQVQEIRSFLEEKRRAGEVSEFRAETRTEWPLESSLVLEEDSGLELGKPDIGSIFFILWAGESEVEDGLISLVGPDAGEAVERSIPFAQVVMVRGSFTDEYDCYRELRDAVYDIGLKGFMVRTLPSRQSIWCRVGREALEEGFSLGDVGTALVKTLKDVDFVSGVEVLFVTSCREDLERLGPTAAGARRLVEAMMKMYEEENFDCSTCEYQDVCETVGELKMMKEKLASEG